MPAFDKGVGIINTQLSIIPIFEQRQINVDLNNVRQRRNNIVIFNVDLHINEYDHEKNEKNKLPVKNIIILLSFNKNQLN